MSQRSVLDESPVFDPSLHRPMMPAGRPSPSSSTNMTFVNLGSASALFSTPSPPVSGGGGMGMAPMSNGGLPPMVPTHPSSSGGGYAMSPMGSWGFPAAPGSGGAMGAPALQPPLQPAVLHPQPHHAPMGGHPQPGSGGGGLGMAPVMGMQHMYQPHPHHQNPQAPFSVGGPAGSMPMLPTPLQPTGPAGSGGGPMGAPPGWNPAAGQHQQPVGSYGHPHPQPMGLAYGQPAPLHYASPPTSQLGAGVGYSPSPPGSATSPTTTSSPGSSSAPGAHMPMSMTMSSMMSASTSTMPTKSGSLGGYGAGPAMGSSGSPGLTAAAQERMRQQQEQIRAEERLKQQQLQVKLLQEEQQRHLREEQERERIEVEKRKAERERMRQEEERKRLEAQREQERQQEALRAEQMRIFEEVRQAQLRVQQEHELQQQKYQMEQFEQQQKIIQEQLKQQEQLRLERLRFEEEQKREEEAARQQQERVKQEEERKRQELLRQELQRQEEFAQEQRRREEALQEKRRQEQQILEQQEKLRQEQARVEQERLQAEQRRNSERMQQEKERLAEEVRQQQERLRLAQEEIQREREKMAVELLREQQRIQEERLRLQAEQERLRQERLERERLEEEARVRHQERMRLHHEQLAHQQEALRQQQQLQMAHLRQQQEQLVGHHHHQGGSPSNPPRLGHFQQPVPHQQQHPLHHHPQQPLPTPGAQTSTWSPFGPSTTPTAAPASLEDRPGETKPRGRAATGGTSLPRPTVAAGAPIHGNGGGKSITLDGPPSSGNGSHVGTGGGSAIVGRQHNPRKPRRPGSPQPLRTFGADSAAPAHPDQIKAEAMASYEAYAAEIARKHRVNDRAEIMTADTMFDSSAFEDKLGLYEGRSNEQRSSYYDDSSDEEGGGSQRGGDMGQSPKRSGSFARDRSQKQGRALISHKTGPAAPTASAGSVPGKRATTAFAALRTGPAGAPRGPQWEKEKEAKSNEPPGHRSMSNDRDLEGRALPQPPERRVAGSTIGPRPLPPLGHSRRRSTGSAAEGDSDDDDDNDGAPTAAASSSSSSSTTPERSEKKSLGLRALVKHHTGALKRSPRGPIYNDPQPGLGASIDSAHALIGELQEAVAHQHNQASAAAASDAPTGAAAPPSQPRSAPLPRAVRQLPPPPSHTSPPPVSPRGHAVMGSKSLPPLPVSRPAGATTTTSTTASTPGVRQLPPKKAPLPPVPRQPLSRAEAALVLQTRWRASRARRHYSQIIMRTRVAREIYSSELVYVQSLGVTIDVFLKPLRRAAEQGKPIILPTDIESVFGNLEEIYAYHLQLVSKLEARISRWNADSQIGDTFLDMKQDFIMLYSSYINHYDQALETIVRCRDLKTWRAFIQRCNQHPECGGLSLESFLILPVQRVTRYVILLRDLRQKTPENHLDYAGISAAQTYMDNICYQVNENKRSAENLKKQMDVLTSLQGKMKPKDMVRDLVDQNRVFVKQAVITLFDQDADKRREVCLFVFNDLLLVTKGDIKKDRYQVIAKFTRDDLNLRLEIMADTNDFMGQEIKNAFVLHTPRVSYLFFCISAEERNQLFEQIRAIFR